MKHIIKAGARYGLNIIFGNLFYARKYAKHPEKYPLKDRYNKVKKINDNTLKHLGTSITVIGEENILNDECVCYIPNHLSNLDCMLLLATNKYPIAFVAKKEVKKMFCAGNYLGAIGGEFMDRSDLRQSLKVMQRVEKELTEKQKSWVIFAEGTRNPDNLHSLGEMHHGSFKAAMKAKAPIVPVALYGAFRVIKKRPEHKCYPLLISYLKPIRYEEYEKMTTEEMAKLVRSRIQSEIIYKLRPLDHELMSSSKDENYRFNYLY